MKAEQQVTHPVEIKGSLPIHGELQRATINEAPVTNVPPIVHEVLRSPGQPLDVETRSFFEQRFGHDFSSVRVHTDAKAAESAQAIEALAYTVGQDVIFDTHQYSPGTNACRQLLTHELTHVVQQKDTRASQRTVRINPELEKEAHVTGRNGTIRLGEQILMRQEKKEPNPSFPSQNETSKSVMTDKDIRRSQYYIDNLAEAVRGGGNYYYLRFGGGQFLFIDTASEVVFGEKNTFKVGEIYADRQTALTALTPYILRGLQPSTQLYYTFYQGPEGAVLPTHYSMESTPRIYKLIKLHQSQMREYATEDEEFWRDFLWGIILWRGIGKGAGIIAERGAGWLERLISVVTRQKLPGGSSSTTLMRLPPPVPSGKGAGSSKPDFRITQANPQTGEYAALGQNPNTGEWVSVKINTKTGEGVIENLTTGETATIQGGRITHSKARLQSGSSKSLAAAPAPGTVLATSPTLASVQGEYLGALRRNAPLGLEVGLYKKYGQAEYRVIQGGPGRVNPPGDDWESVAHFHPGAEIEPGYRNPAPQDLTRAVKESVRYLSKGPMMLVQKVSSLAPDGTVIEVEFGIDTSQPNQPLFVKPLGYSSPLRFKDTYPDSYISAVNAAGAIRDEKAKLSAFKKIFTLLDPTKYYAGWWIRQFRGIP